MGGFLVYGGGGSRRREWDPLQQTQVQVLGALAYLSETAAWKVGVSPPAGLCWLSCGALCSEITLSSPGALQSATAAPVPFPSLLVVRDSQATITLYG